VRSLRLLAGLGLAGLVSAVAAYLLMSYGQSVRQENAIAVHAEQIFRSPTSFVAGNPDGDVSVVAFFDYNCPFCREGAPDLAKLIAEDGKVRLVLKELPVLGKDSDAVARIAQAAIPQGKYLELHQKLFTEPGRVTKEKALHIAAELGLDTAKLENDMLSASVEDAIAANKLLADRLGVEGVPFYLVGDMPLPGSGEDLYAQLETGVAHIRKSGCLAKC
jgi:protein-disulfide isomerase